MSYQVHPSLFPHHDGSELYVSNAAPKIGQKVVLKVRVPHSYTFEKSFVRIYEDGEPRSYELTLAAKDVSEDWYHVEVPIVNTHTLYRFVFVSRDKYDWLNAFGLSDHDVHTNNDFQIVAVPANPEWIKSSVSIKYFRIALQSQKMYTRPLIGPIHAIGMNFHADEASSPVASYMAEIFQELKSI
jgi:alpha-glucosidase